MKPEKSTSKNWTENVLAQTDALELEILSLNTRARIQSDLERLLKEEADIEEQKDLIDEGEKGTSQLTDQLAVAVLTREELEAILEKHQGHFRREIISVLKNVGVHIRVYFNGIMDGNHCMKFAEKG